MKAWGKPLSKHDRVFRVFLVDDETYEKQQQRIRAQVAQQASLLSDTSSLSVSAVASPLSDRGSLTSPREEELKTKLADMQKEVARVQQELSAEQVCVNNGISLSCLHSGVVL